MTLDLVFSFLVGGPTAYVGLCVCVCLWKKKISPDICIEFCSFFKPSLIFCPTFCEVFIDVTVNVSMLLCIVVTDWFNLFEHLKILEAIRQK